MHQRRLYPPAVTLQWSKEPWNDRFKERREDGIELRIGAGPLLSKPQDVTKAIGEEFLPAITPRIVLWQIPAVGDTLEAELPVGRPVGVKSGQLPAERVGFGEPLGEVVEVAQVKVRVGVAPKSAPRNRLGAESGRDGVDG